MKEEEEESRIGEHFKIQQPHTEVLAGGMTFLVSPWGALNSMQDLGYEI